MSFSSASVELLTKQLKDLFSDGLSGLIFDCDGVLIDSKDANIGYYNRLLAECGLPPVREDQTTYVQMSSARQALEYLFPPDKHGMLSEIARRIPYQEVALPLLRLEPDVVPLLRWLQACGLRLGVHTNRGSGMRDVLQRFDLKDLFDPVMTVEVVMPKPHPEGVFRILDAWNMPAHQVVFIGDSSTDAAAAQGGNVPLIAYRNATLPAALHVDSFAVLHAALREAFPMIGQRFSL